jgi:hypothetical protein
MCRCDDRRADEVLMSAANAYRQLATQALINTSQVWLGWFLREQG